MSKASVSQPVDMGRIQIERGMKFHLSRDIPAVRGKAGDLVRVTSVTANGYPSNGFENDWEKIRVSNGKFSWRVDRYDLKPMMD